MLRCLLALPFALWMGLALALRLLPGGWLAGVLSAALPLALLGLLGWLPRRKGYVLFMAAFLAELACFAALKPTNNRNWTPDVARIPTAEVQANRLRVHNVRNCAYSSEFEYQARFEDRTYDLDRLRGMDLFLVSWGPRHIAHTILSFDFGRGAHLALSIETRKVQGQFYSALRGFFRDYELCIIAADERDVIRLRTHFRKETVRLYPLEVPADDARQILMDYVDRMNGLAAHPEWYDALTDNCTTAILGPRHGHFTQLPWSWKVLANGHLDEHLYHLGVLGHRLPFEQLRQQAVINDLAEAASQDPAFSERIRARAHPEGRAGCEPAPEAGTAALQPVVDAIQGKERT